MKTIQLIGAGGLAKDIIACFKDELHISGVWDDQLPKGTFFYGIKVLGTTDDITINYSTSLVIAVASPFVREKIFMSSKKKGLSFETIIHSTAKLFDPSQIAIGEGCIVMPFAYLTTHCSLKENVLLHINSGVHHDASIGEHSVLMPGARVTCGAHLGKKALLSANSIINKIDTYPDNYIL